MKVWHLLVAGIVAIPAITGAYVSSKDTVTATVMDKERVQNCNSDGCTSRYLVFSDGEVFENTDTLIFFKFNSSDIYGRLQPGETYRMEVVGWRVPFFSMYRNILSVDETTASGGS